MRLAVPKLADWATVNVVNPDGSLSRIAIAHRDPAKAALVEELARLSESGSDKIGIYSVLCTGLPQFTPSVTKDTLSGGEHVSRRMELARELEVCSSMILPIFSRGEVVGVLSLAYAESGRHYSEEDVEFFQDFCHHLGILIDNARIHEEVRKRDAVKDTFMATLSHELRNPLAPIMSHLELLRLKSADEDLQEEVRIIEHQFAHMTKLLSDLLDVSRYTLGTIKLERERVSLRHILERITRAHGALAHEKGIALEVELPPSDTEVSADPMRLEQAITNVLHNAEKFTPEGGRITVMMTQDEHEAMIVIRDTGIGMDPDEVANLFAAETPRRGNRQPGEGLGIGLVLVSRIVDLHGGRVSAASPGRDRGSEFRITLPLDHEAVVDDAKSDSRRKAFT